MPGSNNLDFFILFHGCNQVFKSSKSRFRKMLIIHKNLKSLSPLNKIYSLSPLLCCIFEEGYNPLHEMQSGLNTQTIDLLTLRLKIDRPVSKNNLDAPQ